MSKKQPLVIFILGSTSDEAEFESAKAGELLEQFGISWEMSVASAHRNPEELAKYCRSARDNGTEVFIGVAGLSAALPGAIASAINNSRLVLGVPLAGGEWHGLDALTAMQSLPPGTVVGTQKFGKHGLRHAAIQSAQALSISNSEIRTKLSIYLETQAAAKPPLFDRRRSPLLEE